MSFWHIQKIAISGKFNFGTLVALNGDILNGEKKELTKEQEVAKKPQKEAASHTKEEAILHKEQKLRDEFLAYTKDSNIRKI